MKSCYACNKHATTREHVPPKCLFPEQKDLPESVDLRQNLITIPSCEEHNLIKSGNDEYLMYILAMNLSANATGAGHLRKVARAIERRPKLINGLLKGKQSVLVIDDRTREIYETDQINFDGARLQMILNLIAKGIYYYQYSKRWDGAIKVHPDFISYPHESNASEVNKSMATLAICSEKLFAEATLYGENQEVFSYQILEPEEQYHFLMRFSFYGSCKVTAFFSKGNV